MTLVVVHCEANVNLALVLGSHDFLRSDLSCAMQLMPGGASGVCL